MENNNSIDRRAFARIPAALSIRFLPSGRRKKCRGQTIDVSATGIGLLSKKKLTPRTSLEMWLDLPHNRGPFYTRGEVVWSDSLTDAPEYRVGVCLERAELMGLAPVLWK